MIPRFKEVEKRKFDTIDGEVEATCCYDANCNASFIEFRLKTGTDDEFDPYTYVCESDYIDGGIDGMSDSELEDLYHQYTRL